MPSLSVCLAVYNGASTLATALDSVYGQTYKDFDVLVLDDGSTDDSAAIAESYGARVIRQANTGLGGGRQRMMLEATGELVAFIDHDDVWFPDKLERHLDFHLKSGAILSHSASQWEYPDGRVELQLYENLINQTEPLEHLTPNNFALPSATIFARQPLLDAGNFIPEVRVCSDWYGWLLLADRGTFAYLPEPLVRYILRPGQNSDFSPKFVRWRELIIENYLLPNWDTWLKNHTPEQRAFYRQRVKVMQQTSKRQLANFAKVAGDRRLEWKYRIQGEMVFPSNIRSWLRLVKRAFGGYEGRDEW
jgi:glycosyltransferase involved in cell wall biosynthesis